MSEPLLRRDDYEPDPGGGDGEGREKEGGILSFLGELPVLILTAVVVAWLIKTFLVQPFYIPSSSMEPTLLPGDRVLVSKLNYRFREPRREDVIVFMAPERGQSEQQQDFIKRIVGTPGMEIEVDGGRLVVDGEPKKEGFTRPDRPTSTFGPFTVPPDSVFVMGDNRANSKDSRFFGPIDDDDIIGKAFLVYWPPDRVGLLD